MEGKPPGFLQEEIQMTNNTTQDFSLVENPKYDETGTEMQNKGTKELEEEEEKLKLHLGELKKENFTLQITIIAWQKTLENKQEEVKEAESKLDEIYNKIWLERETFCSEADKFNDDYGIFSDWWKTQMDFLSELENEEKKRSDDEKCKQEIEKLEREIEEITKEMEVLEKRKQPTVEVEIPSAENGNPACDVRDEDAVKEPNEEKEMSERDAQMQDCEAIEMVQNDLYSLVDVERVRTANRNRNRRKAFLNKVKPCLTHELLKNSSISALNG